jgi:predicted small metal-binding protein
VDATLKGIVGLIDGSDVEARCAALVVLTHLRVTDEAVVAAVGAALGQRNAVVRDFALGYFEQVRPRGGVTALAALLDSDDDTVRVRVVTALVAYGAPAVSAVRPLLKQAPRRRLNAIIDLCARTRTSTALDLLFGLMAGDDFDANRTACDALLAVVPTLDARARTEMFARAEALAASAPGQRPALVAASKLLGGLGDAKARQRLFAVLKDADAAAVRTHALAALGQCLRGQALTEGEIAQLLPLLASDDEAGIVRPTIHLLEDQTLDRRYLSQLNGLADSPQPLVKRFAVQKLGSFDSGAVVKTLIGYVTDDSYARRDQAASSLKKLPAARLPLMKEFLACNDERKAWTLADILLAHDRGWKRDAADALWTKLQAAVEAHDGRLHTAYFHFLHTLDAAALATRIRTRADTLRKKKDFAGCARWLGLLKDSPAFDADTQCALAIAELKAHRRTLSGPARRHDPALELLRALAGSAFPLAERLRKDRFLGPEELFFAAFHLAEGAPDDRAVARDLLEHLATKHGRTKLGKAAKNKLKLVPA